MSEVTNTSLLNALALAVVLVAALYVLRYAARLMGLSGWWARQRGTPGAPTASVGGCAPGGCGSCSQREAHGKGTPGSP